VCDYGAPFCLAGVDTPLLLSPRGPLCSFYSYASRTITVGPRPAGRVTALERTNGVTI